MRILHIEDESHLVDLVRIICENANLTVEDAPSLAAAKFRLQSKSFDILLLDLNLHDSFGMDTVRELKDYGIPMVILTADPTEEFVREAAELGVSDYLTKTGISRVNLPMRLSFVHSRECARKSVKKRPLFAGLEGMKPYLSCAALA